ncbi:hypothetical protein FDA94_06065 [Herbidospora galbida]|uniref:Uncharacterized protein n=1 Tax=Herbidospora galbida TaxID=2575442 RepID=A0A4U3MP91_9ACTN|nr:hypothetical protein [Herbidospora galbida]TKK90554.1 hypothetical protein FDA94_06065 [Herbidospora galbida]
MIDSAEDDIELEEGQFLLLDVSVNFDWSEFPGAAEANWFETMDNGALILAGTGGLSAGVRLETWDAQPPPPIPGEWQDNVSSQMFSESGEVCVGTLSLLTQTAYLMLGVEDKTWHVRAHRRLTSDRDRSEEYLFQFWQLQERD